MSRDFICNFKINYNNSVFLILSADLHVLAEDGTIAGEAGMDDDDLNTAAHIREQSMIDQESSFEVQVSQRPWWCH